MGGNVAKSCGTMTIQPEHIIEGIRGDPEISGATFRSLYDLVEEQPETMKISPSTNGPISLFVPLVKAIKDRDISEIGKLVQQGGDLNQIDDEGLSCLHWAVECEDHTSLISLIQFLSGK